MGNTSAVADGVKKQGDSGCKELYGLVDLKGGGSLVELMKKAKWTKDYDPLDEALKTEVVNYLIKGGEGECVPISELVKARSKEAGRRTKSKTNDEKSQHHDKSWKCAVLPKTAVIDLERSGENYLKKKSEKKRKICWDRNKRGTVGESILHLCLLNATTLLADLAKRLIQKYPNLVNDIYLGDEYYGESALHMAISNEDPAMVKFLLDNDADCHERCCGNFFCPDDQKGSRSDTFEHEWVEVCENTNYEGHVYFGEYPLSFAACLGQEECVRLLLAKKVNVNLQDTNGNTVMHMLVIHSKKANSKILEIFDLLHKHEGRLDIKNRQGLTPLTLAAKLSCKEVYDHILEIQREVHWMYGNTKCASYPLKDIDTISATGEINKNSALNLIVYGDEEGHLDMMDGLVVNLLKEKWKTFAKYRFYRRFGIFAIYFVCFMISFILRPGRDLCASGDVNKTKDLENCDQARTLNKTVDPCYLLKLYRVNDKARLGLEAVVLFGAVIYIFLAMKEIYHQGFQIFFTTLKGAPAKALFLISCVLVVMMLPGRAFCFHDYEDIVGVLAILCTAPYFLFFCRGFAIVGPFVVMIYNMIRGDLLRFFIIYAIFVIGFSQAMYIVFRDTEKSAFKNPGEAIMNMFVMSLGQFADFYDSFSDTKHPIMGKIVFVIYMIMVTLLLVNMLIAMMGNTYQLVNEKQKEWFRQWAKIILVIEQSVTTEERKQQLIKYSQPINNDEKNRALNIRWHQTEAEKEKLRLLRESKE
ncbi:transient receptor potential cation channel subfamily V member 5-like isoform X2 [Gigantopelta aegis]|uniref:transient receptor potential cation channel subfamily V member 5-like isoform X2 n=1 Tax=Gigantopelta aegis TaxID=1735272 RepID=UPI001B88C69D|nr:transient receptor potential cation channel subfamily V member 5-like isoform X2 [Gigantopelta aegis]